MSTKTNLFEESIPLRVRKEERSLWKIVISCHNSKHEEVRRIVLPEQQLTGNETIGEVVLPTLREELLKMDWNGYGLFAQHEPIYNSTELNDINYQRTIDGTVVLDCEDHNCQWRAIRVPMIQDAECMICLGEIPNDSRVYPKCFHSCVCKTCYSTIERCPKCQKRWKFQPSRK